MRRPPTLETLDPAVREWIYFVATILGEVAGTITTAVATIAAISPDFALPMWVPIFAGLVLVASGRLHAMAKRNVDVPGESTSVPRVTRKGRRNRVAAGLSPEPTGGTP